MRKTEASQARGAPWEERSRKSGRDGKRMNATAPILKPCECATCLELPTGGKKKAQCEGNRGAWRGPRAFFFFFFFSRRSKGLTGAVRSSLSLALAGGPHTLFRHAVSSRPGILRKLTSQGLAGGQGGEGGHG